MAIIAKIVDASNRALKYVTGLGKAQTAPVFGLDDSPPLPDDRCLVVNVVGTGARVVIGTRPAEASSNAAPGERRLYSRNSSGAQAAEIWLHNDGKITMNNGLTIEADGTILAPDIKLGVLQLSILNHIHSTPSGPSGPPTGV